MDNEDKCYHGICDEDCPYCSNIEVKEEDLELPF